MTGDNKDEMDHYLIIHHGSQRVSSKWTVEKRAVSAAKALRRLERSPPGDMDAAPQPTFLTPTTCFTVACVAFSILALTSVWNSQKNASIKSTRPSPKRKVTQRRTVDSIFVSDGPFRKLDEEYAGGTTSQVLSELIELSASIARDLRLRQANGETTGDRIANVTLLSELSHLTTSLCRMQQNLQAANGTAHNGRHDALSACMDTSLAGIREILLFTQIANTSSELRSEDALSNAIQQLRDQRPTIAFLLESMESQPALPPTPPCEADVEMSMKDHPAPGSSMLFPSHQPAITPCADMRAWIEPPPEYTPPRGDSTLLLDVEKVATKSESPVPPEPSLSTEGLSSGSEDKDAATLFDAVLANDVKSVRRILSLPHTDPNKSSAVQARTPLHQAAHLNHSTLIPHFLASGGLLTVEDNEGDTPIHLAAWAGNVEALSALLANDTTASGSDVSKTAAQHPVDHLSGRDGYTPLFCAVSAGHVDAARVLLTRFAARPELRSAGGITVLHQAAITAQPTMLSLLLSCGARVGATDDEGNTALHYAATSGSVACVRALLRAGADIEVRQAQGLMALHWAAHKGHVGVVEMLVGEGEADVDARTTDEGGFGATALHVAATRGHVEVVRCLVEKGAQLRLKGRWDGLEGTSRRMARLKGFGDVVKVLETAATAGQGQKRT